MVIDSLYFYKKLLIRKYLAININKIYSTFYKWLVFYLKVFFKL